MKFLINVDHALEIDSHITLVITSGKEDESPIKLTADVIREASNQGDYAFTYGCMILDVLEM